MFTEFYSRCKKCDKPYGNEWNAKTERCECQLNYSKNNFTSWTSGNKKIDDLIKDEVFKWIPYNQFNIINKINESDLVTAIWNDGLLTLLVVLKNISQNVIDELLNKVCDCSIYNLQSYLQYNNP